MRLPALLTVALALSALAGESWDAMLTDEDLLGFDGREVYVVEILEVQDEGATNAKPPSLRFRIREALRGDAKAGDELAGIWHPGWSGIDTAGGESDARREQWNAMPCPGPAKGSLWILMAATEEVQRPFVPHFRCRSRFSEEKRDEAVAAIEKGRKRAQAEAEAAKRHAEAVAERRKTDEAAQDKRDAAAAAKDAAIVLVARIDLTDLEFGGPLAVSPLQWLKGRPEGRSERDAFPLLLQLDDDARLTLEARASSEAIVLLESPEKDKPLRLAGGLDGVLTATPERLRSVREALGLKGGEK